MILPTIRIGDENAVIVIDDGVVTASKWITQRLYERRSRHSSNISCWYYYLSQQRKKSYRYKTEGEGGVRYGSGKVGDLNI